MGVMKRGLSGGIVGVENDRFTADTQKSIRQNWKFGNFNQTEIREYGAEGKRDYVWIGWWFVQTQRRPTNWVKNQYWIILLIERQPSIY